MPLSPTRVNESVCHLLMFFSTCIKSDESLVVLRSVLDPPVCGVVY